MSRRSIETLVGLFVLMGMAAAVFLALKAANLGSVGGGFAIANHRLVIQDAALPAHAENARVIVLWESTRPAGRRSPPPALAGMGEEKGDILGHEFMGEVVEIGPEVKKLKVGDRVVVVSFTSCRQCWYCKQELWSLCDNGNPNPGITEALWGQAIGGCFGYSP